ncbi:PstS family phosphate ABC transporter substrate-binding protein [Marinithermus hydrothermalis]|uniref:Phosphate-binding protein n=1 Tax=Marinithermus hydrothermalis (strain DSM 14884 / JCM 11576 / T1) TaxID=869210 RepID=F2NNW9_MARHT|nr:PstS family phosphate ABC transporter substrate-binding protein [Marinithermus hydrothermalis]AEB11343.1 phosphate binding protein [Marinithermus hydrothermalis DSM 14884]
MRNLAIPVALVLMSGALAQGDIRVDGSSTVYPITLAIAEEFAIENPKARVTVAFSGTGGGFKKFCAGETDINDASRPIKQSEIEMCRENGVEFIEIPVAFDGVTVVVNRENTFAECLSVEELRRIWEPNSTVRYWSDVRPEWPKEEIVLYGPGTDSGTFDYFTEAVVGETGAIRTDYFPSEDDNVLVAGVEGSPYAMGFFGYAYYVEEADRLNAIAIDNGQGCVAPTEETINNGTYAPLSRPLFIYVRKDALGHNPLLVEFVRFYLSEDAREFIADTGYVPLPDEAYELALERFEQRVTGSLFNQAELGKGVLEILRGE